MKDSDDSRHLGIPGLLPGGRPSSYKVGGPPMDDKVLFLFQGGNLFCYIYDIKY